MSQKRSVLLQRVQAHDGAVNTMCLGKNTGLVFATGGEDRLLNLWSVGKDTPPAVFGPLKSPVTACEFAYSDNEIACGNKSGTVRLFDINALKCACTCPVHGADVTAIAFNPSDKNMMFSVGADGVLQVLTLQSDRPVATFNAHKGAAHCVAVSRDGRCVATGGDDNTVKVFDLKSGKQLASFCSHDGAVRAVEFGPKANVLASGGDDNQAIFYDMLQLSEINGKVKKHSGPITRIRFSQDYDVAVAASGDCLQILGYNPPTVHERVPLDLSRVFDVSVFQRDIIIASAEAGKALITRVKAEDLAPFGKKKAPAKAKPEPKKESKSEAPAAKAESKPKRTESNDANTECTVYPAFSKERGAFMTEMNERYARIGHVGKLVREKGLAGALEECMKKPDVGAELLGLLAEKPQVIKLGDAVMILHITKLVINDNPDLAVNMIDAQLRSFGALVRATMVMASSAVGIDIALEERKEKSEDFVNMFKLLAVDLQRLASGRTKAAKKAASILNDWKVFLK